MIAKDLKIGIIILAAGASARMGKPKQLLEFEGKTLIRRAVETAIETNCHPVVVVLGANSQKIKSEIEDLDVEIFCNENWQNGLSSSLRFGVEKLLKISPQIEGLIISLADQPFVSAKHFAGFIERFRQENSPIIAARYNETAGVPAFFSRKMFAELLKISGDKGAKKLIEKYRESLSVIDVPEAAFDIDTLEDFLKLETYFKHLSNV